MGTMAKTNFGLMDAFLDETLISMRLAYAIIYFHLVIAAKCSDQTEILDGNHGKNLLKPSVDF